MNGFVVDAIFVRLARASHAHRAEALVHRLHVIVSRAVARRRGVRGRGRGRAARDGDGDGDGDGQRAGRDGRELGTVSFRLKRIIRRRDATSGDERGNAPVGGVLPARRARRFQSRERGSSVPGHRDKRWRGGNRRGTVEARARGSGTRGRLLLTFPTSFVRSSLTTNRVAPSLPRAATPHSRPASSCGPSRLPHPRASRPRGSRPPPHHAARRRRRRAPPPPRPSRKSRSTRSRAAPRAASSRDADASARTRSVSCTASARVRRG